MIDYALEVRMQTRQQTERNWLNMHIIVQLDLPVVITFIITGNNRRTIKIALSASIKINVQIIKWTSV